MNAQHTLISPRPLRVYVSGPYSADPETCTATAIAVGNELLDAGYAPFVPHLSHYWHVHHTPRPYSDWLRIDLAWVETADALIRIPGHSPGADQETALATRLGIPIYPTVTALRSADENP